MNTTSSPEKASPLKSSPLKAAPRGVLAPIAALGLAMLAFNAFGGLWRQGARHSSAMLPRIAAATLPSDEAGQTNAIRFLSERVRRDPEDSRAQSMLAGRYLQRLHDTSDHKYLTLALKAAHASLRSVGAEANAGGLTVLVMAEQGGHNFLAARDDALRLTQLVPTKSGSYALLGDALLESGDYDGAAKAFARMEKFGGGSGAQTRLARLDLLRGDPENAATRFSKALALALDAPSPQRETIAWCRWQLGETAFSVGDIQSAEEHLNDALTTYPGYFRALASLGRVRAAQGDLDGAIARYQEALRVVPDPTFLAALGDLYHLAGREREAKANYELAELSATTPANGGNVAEHRRLHSRQLEIFLADHDLKPQQAYAMAKREYAARRDIYGTDALAWTALKAGQVAEAQTAIKDALRLGTRDAKLWYHAGMIARAADDNAAAHDYLQRALDLNAHFDPLQAELARKALND
jgi:tetratricopeptide (TPR) repeat protein